MNIIEEITKYDKEPIKNEDKLNKILDYSTIDFAFFVSVLLNFLPGGEENYIVTKILMSHDGGIKPYGPGAVRMFCIYRKEDIKNLTTELQKMDKRIIVSFNIDDNRPFTANHYCTGLEYCTINIQPLCMDVSLSNRKYITNTVSHIISDSTIAFNDLFFSTNINNPYDDSFDAIPRNIALLHPKVRNYITQVTHTSAIDKSYDEFCLQLLEAINKEKKKKNTTARILTRELRNERRLANN